MRVEGTFTTHDFAPAEIAPAFEVDTAVPVGVATMEKRYDGGISGRSATIFTSAFDPATGIGAYLAMESFTGSIDGAEGTFLFTHSASTTGTDLFDRSFAIVPGGGTGALQGIKGSGDIVVGASGIHRIHIDYTLD